MQLLVAYGLDDAGGHDVAAGIARVEAYYSRLWRGTHERHGCDSGTVGVHVWDEVESPWRWPAWQQDAGMAVATVYAPLGYERAVGDVPPERAAVPLARALIERPASVALVLPRFVVVTVEPHVPRLTLLTDALGVGRLFQLRFGGGWVWSNRPIAACLFAGIPAVPDDVGWRLFAAAGWFLGDHTSLERVHVVPAATRIEFDGQRAERRELTLDVLGGWAGDRRDVLSQGAIDDVAAALQAMARSTVRLWNGPILVDLSGGRDSRVVCAAFLSAGAEVQLHTKAAEPGEVEVAQQLVAALPQRLDHWINESTNVPLPPDQAGATLERAVGWHRFDEGLAPPRQLPAQPPSGFSAAGRVDVGGFGGETAHGFFYAPDTAEIEALPYGERMDRFLDYVTGRVLAHNGATTRASLDATHEVRRVMLAAARAGVDDARTLDYFYVASRLRRWGTAAATPARLSPLLVPEFQRAAFALTTKQRGDNELHRALTARLVPEWRDVPYYRRPERVIAPAVRPRLAQAVDVERITDLVLDTREWADGHDVAIVQRAWTRLLAGRGGSWDEMLMQRVIWRDAFADFLAEVNGTEPRPRQRATTLPVEAPAALATRPPPVSRTPLARGRRLAARTLRRAARLVDPG